MRRALLLVLVAGAFGAVACQGHRNPASTGGDDAIAAVPTPTPAPTQTPCPTVVPKPGERSLRLMAVGTITMDDALIQAGYNAYSDSYDYSHVFRYVEPIFDQADFVIGNLEAPLAGKERGGYTGYPRVNAPEVLAKNLKDAGVNVLATATNHALDRSAFGVHQTIRELQAVGIRHTGTFGTPEQRDKPLILEQNGISVGLVNYTSGTDDLTIPEDQEHLVNPIDLDLIAEDIQTLRYERVDVIAVAFHFATEQRQEPDDFQRQVVNHCFEQGVDLVLGCSNSGVQPYGWVALEQPDGSVRNGYVIYSMGNFISNQRDEWRDVGCIVDVTISKTGDERGEITRADIIPTYVDRTRTERGYDFAIYPIAAILTGAIEADISNALWEKMARLGAELEAHVARYTYRLPTPDEPTRR